MQPDQIVLPGGWYFEQLNPPHGVVYALRTPKGKGFGISGTGMSAGKPVVEAFARSLNASGDKEPSFPDLGGLSAF